MVYYLGDTAKEKVVNSLFNKVCLNLQCYFRKEEYENSSC